MTVRNSFILLLASLTGLSAAPLVDFPTDNRAITQNEPSKFFMYVTRNFEGEKSNPWQGGQYGYVRNPQRNGGKVIYTRLHEGIDISPVRRDASGNPLDEIRAAADGKVVHASTAAGASNYGRYVVIEHRWDGSKYYSLYAHLAKISVKPGQNVRQGEPIGVMGYTGAGIDRTRAHVHFEVCLLLSENFETWHAEVFRGSPNHHGIYNGLNLVGIDPTSLLLNSRKNPSLRIADAIRSNDPAFKIRVRNTPNLSLVRRYPWLVANGEDANPRSWVITFNRHGAPINAEASDTPTTEPVATWKAATSLPYTVATKGYVGGTSEAPKLTSSGMRFARLLTWPD